MNIFRRKSELFLTEKDKQRILKRLLDINTEVEKLELERQTKFDSIAKLREEIVKIENKISSYKNEDLMLFKEIKNAKLQSRLFSKKKQKARFGRRFSRGPRRIDKQYIKNKVQNIINEFNEDMGNPPHTMSNDEFKNAWSICTYDEDSDTHIQNGQEETDDYTNESIINCISNRF